MYKFSTDFKNYTFTQINSGASKKKFYRLKKNTKSFILTDFNSDKQEYLNYMKVYNILRNLDISIPEIIEKNEEELIIISEDFGDLRFDKIIHNESIKNLLQYAVDSLIVINKSIKFDNSFNLPIYSFEDFKEEIMELPKFYFPYLNIKYNNNLTEEYLYIWSQCYNNFNFNFNNFVHKDFNINNLILLPSQKNHLRCGIIDFQSAFWGEGCWDLFSLLEDSRIFFTDDYNHRFINYVFSNTNHNISLIEYKLKYHFLNCSRQSRLLGRWIKLCKDLNAKWYLDFIPVTKRRLKKSLTYLGDNHLSTFYKKNIFNYEI